MCYLGIRTPRHACSVVLLVVMRMHLLCCADPLPSEVINWTDYYIEFSLLESFS